MHRTHHSSQLSQLIIGLSGLYGSSHTQYLQASSWGCITMHSTGRLQLETTCMRVGRCSRRVLVPYEHVKPLFMHAHTGTRSGSNCLVRGCRQEGRQANGGQAGDQ